MKCKLQVLLVIWLAVNHFDSSSLTPGGQILQKTCWLSVNNNGTGWSRCEKFPLICDFACSMYRVFDVDRNLIPKKRTGNLEADEICILS